MPTMRIMLFSLLILALAAPVAGEILSQEYEEHLARGRQLLRAERYDEAILELGKAEALAPGQSLAALSGLTRAYRRTDQPAKAIAAHQNFLGSAADPELAARASNMLGVLLLQYDPGAASLEESEQAFRRALELEPIKAFRARLNLAEALHRAGGGDAARAVLEGFPPAEPTEGWRFMATDPVSDHVYDLLTELLLARNPETPVYFQGSVTAPAKISAPMPLYTVRAAENRIEGSVIVRTVITRTGNVASVEVLKGLPGGLSEEATAAYLQWRFKAATFRGRPVTVYYNLTTNFVLPDKGE